MKSDEKIMVADIYHDKKGIPDGVYFHYYYGISYADKCCLDVNRTHESTDINDPQYRGLSEKDFQYKVIEKMKSEGYQGD